VLEYLVIDLLSDYNLRAAWLASPAESGYIAEIASYGCFESRAFDAHRPAVWSNDPMATAITANEPVITRVREAREIGQNNTPFLAEEISFAAVMPVQPNQESRFVLGVGCAGAAEDARACLDSLMETRPLLAIYLAFLRTGPDENGNNTTHAAESTDLTPRQSTILQLIAQGMKNREIAFTIGFSESTVRLDTIEIYRKLGVQGRHEAARVALRLGILDPDDLAHQGAHKLADP